jgi:parallel beta-helix repeat protein
MSRKTKGILLLFLGICLTTWIFNPYKLFLTYPSFVHQQQPNLSLIKTGQSDKRFAPQINEIISPPQVPHAPIDIYQDINFHLTAALEGWLGDGSSGNPYIIEDYLIDVGGGPFSGIHINISTVYFIIRHCTILGATSVGLLGSGILLENVTNGQLINNTCYNNRIGINLRSESALNTLANNTCTNNTQYGLELHSSTGNNTIHWNCFSNNPTNAYDDAVDNIFDYNYFSDYGGSDGDANGIGDTPHTLPGATSNQDLHPLMYCPKPPTWVASLPDHIIEFGNTFAYDLDATHAGPLTWSLIASPSFTIDTNGLVTNAISLAVGFYLVQVRVSNIYGVFLDGSFWVTVQDTTPPTWVTPPTDQNLVYAVPLDHRLEVTDLSGIDRWVLDDPVNFTISNTGWLTNARLLAPGIYSLTISVFDPYDNELSATISITVQAPLISPAIFVPFTIVIPVAVKRVIKTRNKQVAIQNIAINGKLVGNEDDDPHAPRLETPILGGTKAILSFNAGTWKVLIKKWGGEIAKYEPFNIRDLEVTIKTAKGDSIKVEEITCKQQQNAYALKFDEIGSTKCKVPPFICPFTPPVYAEEQALIITIQVKQSKSKTAHILLHPPPDSVFAAVPMDPLPTPTPKESEVVILPLHNFTIKRPSSPRVYTALAMILPWIASGLLSLTIHPLLDLFIIGVSIIDFLILLWIILPKLTPKEPEATGQKIAHNG